MPVDLSEGIFTFSPKKHTNESLLWSTLYRSSTPTEVKMDTEMINNDVGHDDETVKVTNCQMQPKEAHMSSKPKSDKCNLCHPTELDADIFAEYYFCDKCLSQL